MDKIKLLILAIMVFIALLVFNFLMFKAFMHQTDEVKRLSSNIEALRTDVEKGLSKDGKETTTAKQQTLTKGELKEILHDELKSLNIKERDVKQVIITASETKVDVPIDTMIENDTTPNKPEYRYKDEWADLRMDGDSAHIRVKDSLLVANHAKTKKFLWWRWKKYSGKTTIKNYSPYSTITGITTIDVEQ